MIASGISGLLSWIIVIIQPCSIYLLLGSRLLAGLSNGLLTGNVYMADVAPSKFISSFKAIEVITNMKTVSNIIRTYLGSQQELWFNFDLFHKFGV